MSKALLLSMALTFSAGFMVDIDNTMKMLETTYDILYLATVDGKSFFAHEGLMNWTAAQNYCTSSAMSLATITSTEQVELITGAYDPNKFASSHWINARDVQNLSQFVWDNDGSALSSLVLNFTLPPDLTYCMDFTVWGTNYSESHAHPCSTSNIRVLCEIRHGQHDLIS